MQALIESGFEVTILTRAKKTDAENNNQVKVVEVDFTSPESLRSALKYIDAVVSAVGGSATDSQTVLIDAAIATGVKRFIPSEFGSVTVNPALKDAPIYSSLHKIREYLEAKAQSGQLTWTVLACGAFSEFLFGQPIFLNHAKHEVTLYDGGNNRISTTSLSTIGKAIAKILQNPGATANRVVRVSEAIVTQNELLKIAQEIQPETQWTTTNASTADMFKAGVSRFEAGDHSWPAIMDVTMGTAFAGDKYGAAFDVTDNELLGVKALTPDDIRKLVAASMA